jgi:hypothetical protein
MLSAKAQLAVRVSISTQQPRGHERGFRGDDTASSRGLAAPPLSLADWGGAFISRLPLDSNGAMASDDFALLVGLALVALLMFVLQAFVCPLDTFAAAASTRVSASWVAMHFGPHCGSSIADKARIAL